MNTLKRGWLLCHRTFTVNLGNSTTEITLRSSSGIHVKSSWRRRHCWWNFEIVQSQRFLLRIWNQKRCWSSTHLLHALYYRLILLLIYRLIMVIGFILKKHKNWDLKVQLFIVIVLSWLAVEPLWEPIRGQLKIIAI